MGLIREAQWTKGGHRLYDESVFESLSAIMKLKRTKTLGEIRRILKERSDCRNLSLRRTAEPNGKTQDQSSGSEIY